MSRDAEGETQRDSDSDMRYKALRHLAQLEVHFRTAASAPSTVVLNLLQLSIIPRWLWYLRL